DAGGQHPAVGHRLGASPRTLPVFCGTTMGVVSLPLNRFHCTRVSTRCCSHWSAPVASAPTQPGVREMAVTTMGRPRSICRTCPSAPLRTHTHAWVGSVPATAWAALDPGGQPGAEAV